MHKIILYSGLFFPSYILAFTHIINTIGSHPTDLVQLNNLPLGTVINHIAADAQKDLTKHTFQCSIQPADLKKSLLIPSSLLNFIYYKFYAIFNFFPYVSKKKKLLLGGCGIYTLLNTYFFIARSQLLHWQAWTQWKKNIPLKNLLEETLETQMHELYSELIKRYGADTYSHLLEKVERDCQKEIRRWYWYVVITHIVETFLAVQHLLLQGIIYSGSLALGIFSFLPSFFKDFSFIVPCLQIMHHYKSYVPHFSLSSFFFIDLLLIQKKQEMHDRLAYICFLTRCLKEKNYAV